MSAATIHASCILLSGAGQAFGAPSNAGVLLLGESGTGKSGMALQLIARGAALVADDRVELFTRDGALWARAPAPLAGLIEARGVGIVKLPYATEARIALAVRLVSEGAVTRLPERENYAPPDIGGVREHPPLIRLSASDPAAPAKIALAAAAFFSSLFREEGNPP
jgi:HPr kinase/phosphorylase